MFASEVEVKAWLREIVREEVSQLMSNFKIQDSCDDGPLMTRAEIAQFLRISLVTLTDWVKRGLPVRRKRKGGRVLFIKSEVLTWLKDNHPTGGKDRI